uniref:Hydrophobic seed protein domain-containing protein n=1 Tax=Setaria viridis TaxID=4556 RepID=A0A4U6W0W3_SETVI|nr:hypothetical protein SEVIR_2G355301v2 [Setaria viridis]
MAKPWKQQALILVAALLLGLSLPVPGSADPLGDACFLGLERLRFSTRDLSCGRTILDGFDIIDGTSRKMLESAVAC